MSNNYAGIDYSGLGSKANRDEATGIRYGVVSQNSINPDVMSDIWSEARDLSYEAAVEDIKQRLRDAVNSGDPRQYLQDSLEDMRLYTADIDEMEAIIRGQICSLEDKVGGMWDVISDTFGDQYQDNGDRSWLWEKDGYTLSNCLQSDVFVSRSPYFTYAQHCSPCCPGALNLDNPFEGLAVPQGNHASFAEDFKWNAEAAGFPACYCLGRDFFEGEKAPYEVFSVATGKRVVMVEKLTPCPNCKGSGRDNVRRLAEVRGCDMTQVYLDIGNGNIQVDDYKTVDPVSDELGTFKCWRCGGLGYEVKKVSEEQ